MFDFVWKESRGLYRWGSPDFLARVLVVGLVAALFLVAHTSTSLAQSPPVAAYSFDEGSGTTVKDSARNHNGTISGATWAAVGKYGSALDFDGVNDLVSIADASDLDLTNAFTLEAWVRPDTLTANRPVIAKSESAGGNSGYLLSARYAGNPTGFVASSGTAKSVARPSPLPEAVWSHLVFTSDGTNLRLYVDGEIAATAPAIAAKATAASLVIGYGQVLGGYFDGMIDEVRLYNETLSESQIQTDRDTAVGLDQIPVAAYSFDEGAGTTLGDSIDNHDGTISGATWTTGKYGSALNFDGVNDLVSIADAADLDLTSSFTLEAWVNPTSTTVSRPVISKGEAAGGNSGYALSARYTSTPPAGVVANAGTLKSVSGPSALKTGEWSHLAITSDGTTLRLYINGSFITSASAISAKATNAALEIGHSFLGGYFGGLIDEVRLHNETLSESQIQTDRDSRVQAPALHEVTTSVLDTGPSAEKVSSVPITASGTETVVYSLPVPSVKAGEILRVMANLEVTNEHTYNTTDSVGLILGSNGADTKGTVVTPWTSVTHTPDMRHWTLPLVGIYEATSSLGTQYLKVVLKASSPSAKSGDTLVVQPNFGRLAVMRSTPVVGPMSQPTDELQPQTDPLPELITNIPVDSSWQRVMTRKASSLSYNDILEIASQIAIQNTSGATVLVESKITRTSAPSTAGSWASPPISDRLSADMPSARIIHSNQLLVSDPGKPYLNLSVRAVPISGTPSPLTVTAGATTLNIIHHKADLGDPASPLKEGTLIEESSDFNPPNVTSIPFALGSAPQPRVVASTPLYGGLWKDEMIRARGLITGDLAGGEKAQLLTSIVLADSPTATTGETIGVFSGDFIPTGAQIHTVIKEGLYVVPKAEDAVKYVNFVAKASRLPAYTGEAMNVLAGSVYLTRSKPTTALDEGFEDGLGAHFESTSHGSLSTSTAHAREGSKSLLTSLDFSKNVPESNPFNLHNEVKPPDKRTSGGYEGEDSWYGFSAYFPKNNFTLGPDSGHFNGLIDEVRLYHQFLTQSEIIKDRDGEYGKTPTPVAAYKFDEGSGITVADSAGDNDGVVEGATWALAGKYGSALNFDGTDDQVTIPDAEELDFSNSFTLEAWLRPDDVAVWDPVITKAESESNVGHRLLAAAGALAQSEYGAPTGLVGTEPGVSASAADVNPLSTNTWSHLALTFDGTNLRLYVNGELIATAASAGAALSGSDLMIGASDVPGGGAAVLDTVFMQWHGSNEGLDCNMQGGRPPIAFSVRRFHAGEWTNPGESETATPVTGDYIYVAFNGGELDANCKALNFFTPEIYVLASLERERWYDFVLHTRWTTEKGSPGNSVSEVWLDGEQIVGDESHSVTTPNLYWHGTPAIRNPIINMQFGIYRHLSGSQPTSQLYMDAVRRGNSYAEVAPGQ